MNAIALPANAEAIIAEYEQKALEADAAIRAIREAHSAFGMATCVQGTFVESLLPQPHVSEVEIKHNLLKSGWRAIYNRLNISEVATAKDKQLFDRAMADPPPLTVDNARATFGDYLLNPRQHILRGLAEIFCALDPAYKSHSKVKIGVKGLPKRIILHYWNSFSSSAENQFMDLVNALAAFQRKPQIGWAEMRMVKERAIRDGEFAMDGGYMLTASNGLPYGENEPRQAIDRGITVRAYQNGNAHIIFDKATLLDINRALAEYYGEVLPDAEPENSVKRASAEVSRDLQFYWTPPEAAQAAVGFADIYNKADYSHGEPPDYKILEPSCGEGHLMAVIAALGWRALGIEVHPGRAARAKLAGHNVLMGNFLEQPPTADFNRIVMNPPFYGKHYAKHVRHAVRFLKPGGILVAILPATARYDHSELDDLIQDKAYMSQWRDLPVGSFSAAGTNVPTTMLRIARRS